MAGETSDEDQEKFEREIKPSARNRKIQKNNVD